MTNWQWQVILAIIRIVLYSKTDWYDSDNDISLLHEALAREMNKE